MNSLYGAINFASAGASAIVSLYHIPSERFQQIRYSMKDPSFSVAEAAEQAGTSVSSVRRWIAEFAPHFSPGAKPEKGVFRRLSAQDIQVLQEIARLKEDNLSASTINERLAGLVFQAPIVESSQAAQYSPGQSENALMVVEVLRSVEARLQALEGQRQRFDTLWLVVFAFAVGLLTGLAVWWFQ